MSQTPDRPPYDTLKIAPDSTFREVRQGYKKLIREFTPEHQPEEFAEINLAYRKVSGEVADFERIDRGIHPITVYPVRRFDEIFVQNAESTEDKLAPLAAVPETIFDAEALAEELLQGFL